MRTESRNHVHASRRVGASEKRNTRSVEFPDDVELCAATNFLTGNPTRIEILDDGSA